LAYGHHILSPAEAVSPTSLPTLRRFHNHSADSLPPLTYGRGLRPEKSPKAIAKSKLINQHLEISHTTR
jgi:hypothetical protein